MIETHNAIFTIGHSTHSFAVFLELLKSHEITALADVRSAPFSRHNPQFNKDALERDIRPHGIKYVFLGRELGARSNDPASYRNGRVQYFRLALSDQFQKGIERVIRGAKDNRVALMCAEREPLECHRALLVAPVLEARGINVCHVLGDGRLESHRDAMERLLDVTGVPRIDLFRSREELITEALALQEKKVAYVDESMAADASVQLQ